MKIEKTQTGDQMTFVLEGWLDTQAAPELEAELKDLPADVQKLVFDCTSLEYISSSGIRQFVAAHKQMSGSLTLVHVSAEIMDVLNMTGIAKKLNIEQG